MVQEQVHLDRVRFENWQKTWDDSRVLRESLFMEGFAQPERIPGMSHARSPSR